MCGRNAHGNGNNSDSNGRTLVFQSDRPCTLLQCIADSCPVCFSATEDDPQSNLLKNEWIDLDKSPNSRVKWPTTIVNTCWYPSIHLPVVDAPISCPGGARIRDLDRNLRP